MKLLLALCAVALFVQGQVPLPPNDRDVFAFVRAMDEAGARQVWPGFKPSEWPVAVFDGTQTILLRHPSPPPEFTPLAGHPGVLAVTGRHPAVVTNSTREIGGVRTGTVIVTPAQGLEGTMLAYVEEIFHVFWLQRHANFRPNEMARYAYPLNDAGHLQRLLAEDEALARALDSAHLTDAAAWAGAALQIRRDRRPSLADYVQEFETGLEMMEGTANYVARVAVGQSAGATAARLRVRRDAEGIRWRFYDTGAAICFLLDRFQPDWKARIDSEPELTTAGLLEAAVARSSARPAVFSPTELAVFGNKAAAEIEALSARQRSVRADLSGRPGPRVVIEVGAGAEPLRVTRFDPINLLVLGAGEIAHANYITLTSPAGTIDIRNGTFTRGSFAGTVSLTRGDGPHPLADGIRMVTVAGLAGLPKIERREDGITLEGEGVRITLRGAEARVEGETVRVGVGGARSRK